jgi:D-inositol-3-phosphate glycosyltransferase
VSGPARIALTGLAPPLRGGIAHYTLHLAAALARIARVRLFAWARQYPAILFPGTTQIDPSPLGLPVETVRSLDPLGPWTWPATALLVRRFGARRIVHQWWHPWFAPATLSVLDALSRSGTGITVVAHNLEPHEPVPGAALAARIALGRADTVIVHGERDAGTARSWWPRADVIVRAHPPYHTLAGPRLPRAEARRRLGLGHDGPLVLFFGCVRPYKGLQDLIDAMPLIVRGAGDVRLAIAGEFYEPAGPYERRVRELGLGDRVLVRNGYVPNADVGLWLGAADVAVLPYRRATGSGVLPLARAAGLPVVATRVGDLPDAMVEGRDGRLVPARDPGALGRAVAGLLASPPDAEAIARAAAAGGWDDLARAAIGREPA